MDPLPLPTTLQEVEALINKLYEPNPPATVSRIQDVLQRLQKSAEGWQVAEGLLALPSDNVKFFGALTFIVKLNTEALEDEAAQAAVLQKLIDWLLASLENGAGPIVLRKLCSALVTHFIHFSHLWPLCIRHLLYCLDLNRGGAIDSAQDVAPPADQMIRDLPPHKAIALAWFATSLAEEAEKTDPKTTKYISLHERLARNAQDVGSILGHLLGGSLGTQPQNASISCLQAWMTYGQRVPNEQVTASLRPLLRPTIECLAVDDLYEVTIELLTDILNNWQNFFTKSDYELLYALFDSDWSQRRYQALLQGDFDFDAVQFGLFMVAFGDSQITELMNRSDARAQQFLSGLVGLLSAKGYPVAEDKIFVPALDFWAALVETMTDSIFSEPDEPVVWDVPPMSYLMQVVSHCWRKIQYPPPSEYNAWDSTDRVGFSDARKDVSDLLQSMYTIAGRPLISLFVDLTLQALSSTAWAELEAAAFCLGSLSDCVSDSTDCDGILSKIFGSQLFDLLRQGQSVVPVRARQTCLSLIERYSDYFARHAEFLPAALNLLFSAVSDPPLASSSSKSIFRLCSSCRSLLTSEVEAFLNQYESLRENVLDSLAEERVVGAIASIIQAVTEETRRFDAFRRLLLLIGTDVERCLELKAYNGVLTPDDARVARAFDAAQLPTAPLPSSEVAVHVAIRALRCLLGTAKGLQSPSELPVDIDADEDTTVTATPPNLEQAQREIIAMLIRMKDTFSESSEALGVICSIIRAGFSESEPGPFVFPPQMVIDFLTSAWYNRVAAAVNTACAFVSSIQNGASKGEMPQVLGRLLPWIIDILGQLQEPENDPELAQYGIEFLQKAMTKRPDVFMQLQPTSSLEFVFMFSIKMLNGSEPLPKAAAADFWTNFMTLKADEESTQATIDSAMGHLGPIVAQSLMHNIGGKAARSDLDKLSDPLKKLVVQHVHSRRWLESALNDNAFPSDKVSPDDKALFLKKITSLRGSRATNQVVKEFWLACRGSNFAYAS